MMKLLINHLVLLLTLLSCNGSHGQLDLDQNLIESKLLLRDLDTLKHWITKAHGDPYRFTTRDALNRQFKIAKQKVLEKKSVSGNEFAGIVMPIIAELRDGHAQVFLPNLDVVKGNLIFPIKFVFIEKKPYVLKNMASENIEIGSEILEINGQSAESFFGDLIPYLHRDGDIETVRYRRLENQSYLTRILIAFGKASSAYSIKIKNKDNSIKSYKLKGLSQKKFNSSFKKASQKQNPLSYSKVESHDATALLSVKSFNPDYFKNEMYYKQIDSIFQSISKDKISDLIIDLRNNNGGEDSYVMYLLRYLLDKEFSFHKLTFRQNNYKFLPDGKHWDIAPNCFKENDEGTYDATEHLWEDHCTIGTFKPFKNRFKGKLVVLINAFSFSAASCLASNLFFNERALFVGEETGGSSIGSVSGWVPTLDLPISNVKVNLPLTSVKAPFFGSHFNKRGVIPHYQVVPSITSILNEKDDVMIKAMDLIE